MKKKIQPVKPIKMIVLVLLTFDSIFMLLKAVNSLTIQKGVYPAFTTIMCAALAVIILSSAFALIFKSERVYIFFADIYCTARMLIIAFESKGQLDLTSASKLGIMAGLIIILGVSPILDEKSFKLLMLKIFTILLSSVMAIISINKILYYVSIGFWIFYTLFFTLSDGLFFTALTLVIAASLLKKV